MKRPLAIFALVLSAAALGACETPPHPVAPIPPFYAPATLQLATASTALNAHQILPASDAEEYFTPRAEKIVYGAVDLGQTSYFTTYTFDSERISAYPNTGYRYRWVVQSGITFP